MENSLMQLELAICSACNLRCKHCYQSNRSEREIFIDLTKLREVLDNAKELGATHLIITGGEPLLHPKFTEIIQHANENGFDIKLYTNGLLLNRETVGILKENSIHNVQVSVEGFQDVHDYIRGRGTFQKTISNVSLLIENGITVIVNTQITTDMIDRLDEWIDYLDKMEVTELNLTITGHLGDARQNNIRTPDIIFSELNGLAGFTSENSDSDGFDCGAMINRLAIHYDGNVYPCDFFKSIAQYSLGNIYRESLIDIYSSWTNSDNELMRYLDHGIEECNGCHFASKCRRCAARIYSCYKNFNHTDPLYCALFGKTDIPSDIDISKLVVGNI